MMHAKNTKEFDFEKIFYFEITGSVFVLFPFVSNGMESFSIELRINGDWIILAITGRTSKYII